MSGPTDAKNLFMVGQHDFTDLEIRQAGSDSFYYFYDQGRKGLVKAFGLMKGERVQYECEVKLVKAADGQFSPKFCFSIYDLSKKATLESKMAIADGESRKIKSRVDLQNCQQNFWALITFVLGFKGISPDSQNLAVVPAESKQMLDEILGNTDKKDAVAAFSKHFAGQIGEDELNIIAGRKQSIDEFSKLMMNQSHFEAEQAKCTGPEQVWQKFFEGNSWIFGYGLQLVSCEALDGRKLETIVVGGSVDSAGKRTDAYMKTKGRLSSVLFCEIKTHCADLLEKYPRPSVYSPAKELRGAVAQLQKTIHMATLLQTTNSTKIKDNEGEPTGEQLFRVRPKGVVVIGKLSEFEGPNGVSEEKFASFELYRQSITGIDILTFDELYERARHIVTG